MKKIPKNTGPMRRWPAFAPPVPAAFEQPRHGSANTWRMPSAAASAKSGAGRFLLLGLLFTLAAAHARDVEVTQKGKQFSRKSVTVKAGDYVSFRNDDPFAHNVFSMSPAKTFDLGAYGQGKSKKVQFDTPGTVDIECAIHPQMKMVIQVEK